MPTSPSLEEWRNSGGQLGAAFHSLLPCPEDVVVLSIGCQFMIKDPFRDYGWKVHVRNLRTHLPGFGYEPTLEAAFLAALEDLAATTARREEQNAAAAARRNAPPVRVTIGNLELDI